MMIQPIKTVAFFNNKGGVGKTSLVYHLAWMFGELGLSVLAVDLDPQANLTSMFLPDSRLEELWPPGKHRQTIQGVIDPMIRGIGDIQPAHIEDITPRIGLLVGDLALSGFEDKLSWAWPSCLDRDESAFRITTAFYRAAAVAAQARRSDIVLFDVGPNLGAINRSVLIGSEAVVIPLAPDLFSLQGLQNLGPQLRQWRSDWKDRQEKNPEPELLLPSGTIAPIGYVLMQHAVRADRPVKAYQRWMERIPGEYRQSVLGEPIGNRTDVSQDPYCLALIKHYRSLMPMAMEARKPIFHLKPADGAIGAHVQAVSDSRHDFEALARRIAERCQIAL